MDSTLYILSGCILLMEAYLTNVGDAHMKAFAYIRPHLQNPKIWQCLKKKGTILNASNGFHIVEL